jgi:hypothetical protein
MNYIKQLNAAMIRFSEDSRLHPAHISLYLALFQLWNLNRFRNPTSINRSEAMNLSRIGSVGTYHRSIKQLDEWGYLKYQPSYNPLKGSKVYMFDFDTTHGQAEEQPSEQVSEHLSKQLIEPSLNNTKDQIHSKQVREEAIIPPSIDEVRKFFRIQESTDHDADSFYDHFESNGWLVGGKTKMKNWHAASRNWIKRSKEYQKQPRLPSDTKPRNHNVNQNKDYTEPL